MQLRSLLLDNLEGGPAVDLMFFFRTTVADAVGLRLAFAIAESHEPRGIYALRNEEIHSRLRPFLRQILVVRRAAPAISMRTQLNADVRVQL